MPIYAMRIIMHKLTDSDQKYVYLLRHTLHSTHALSHAEVNEKKRFFPTPSDHFYFGIQTYRRANERKNVLQNIASG